MNVNPFTKILSFRMSRKAKEDAFSKGIHLTAEKKIRFRNNNTSSQTDPAAGNRNYPILNSHQSVYILSLFEPFELIIFCFFQKIHSDQTVCPVCPIFDAGFQLPCLVNVIFFTLCSNLPKKNSFFQKRFLSVQNARRAVLNGWINVQSGFLISTSQSTEIPFRLSFFRRHDGSAAFSSLPLQRTDLEEFNRLDPGAFVLPLF